MPVSQPVYVSQSILSPSPLHIAQRAGGHRGRCSPPTPSASDRTRASNSSGGSRGSRPAPLGRIGRARPRCRRWTGQRGPSWLSRARARVYVHAGGKGEEQGKGGDGELRRTTMAGPDIPDNLTPRDMRIFAPGAAGICGISQGVGITSGVTRTYDIFARRVGLVSCRRFAHLPRTVALPNAHLYAPLRTHCAGTARFCSLNVLFW